MLPRAAIEGPLEAMLHHAAALAVNPTSPEAIHKLRVATRRLRAALATYAPLLPQKKLAKARKRLRRLGRALGPVREADVHLTALSRDLEAAASEAERCAIEHVADRIAAERAAAATALAGTLAAARVERTAARLRALAEGARPAGEDLARATIAARAAPVFEGIDASREADEPAALHLRRIAAKKLRYTIEALDPAGGSDLLEFAHAIQETLGRHRDAVALAARLDEERRRLEASGRTALPAALAGALARRREEQRQAFADYVALTSPDRRPAGWPASRTIRATPDHPPRRPHRRTPPPPS